MDNQFRLYVGLVINDDWFNYAEIEEMKGGVITLLDSADKSAVGRLKKLLMATTKRLYTAPGEDQKCYELKERDYDDIKMEDAWKIGLEVQKMFLDNDRPITTESFFCSQCSRRGEERYTTIESSWQELIENGTIDEVYNDTEDCSIVTILPYGIEVGDENKAIASGVYRRLTREPITIGETIKLSKTQALIDNEATMLCAIWDTQIKKIEGLSSRDLNILKRNIRDPFTKIYLTRKEDIDEMSNGFRIGLDAKYRTVSCKYCQNEIGGGLDFTNFFDFALPKRSNRNMSRNSVV